MSIGQRIKSRREELGLSVDYVAEKLGKNRATVYRYESEDIKNFPCEVLEPLALILRTTPAQLMGYEPDKALRPDEKLLLEKYNSLNKEGRSEAIRRIEEMSEISRFRQDIGLLDA